MTSDPVAQQPAGSRRGGLTMDAALLAMVVIWAGNYSLAKWVFREMPPTAFNAVRMAIASLVFLALLRRAPDRHIPRGDWLALLGLGVVGHFVYQLGFIGGLARTSVANAALIIGCSPVAIALTTAAAGHERIGRLHWLGAALSVAGLYLVAGRDAAMTSATRIGDALMLGSVCCWAVYTVASRALLVRHSPLVVTGYSMTFGTALFVLATAPATLRTAWSQVSGWAWAGTLASAVLALNVAYLIWYTAVQRIGNARTSLFSNMVPLVALLFAWAGLGERIPPSKFVGAAAILAGVLVTRLGHAGGRTEQFEPPPEE
jgi:drug/metabolite transporter (DMT)-like permease